MIALLFLLLWAFPAEARTKTVVNGTTGQAQTVPLTAQEEAEADARDAGDVTELRALRTGDVKAELRRRVGLVQPEDQQLMAVSRAVELIDKGSANWTVPEQAEAQDYRTKQAAIKALRGKAETLIQSLAAMNAAQLKAFTPRSDINWQ